MVTEFTRCVEMTSRFLTPLILLCLVVTACDPEPAAPTLPGAQVPAEQELALRALTDFFEHLNAGRYPEASQLFGGSYQVVVDHNPNLAPQDHAALLRSACTTNGFRCLRTQSARLQEQMPARAEFCFLVEFSTPEGELFVRGPCCGASETEMPPQSAFTFAVIRGEDGVYRVQDLPVYVP